MAAQVQIPDELKKDLPPTKWGKILSATPVVMAVIATMLAGLASSEMTHAQYDRSLAAQLQSKAGDQWSYYQAKKLRSAVAHNTLDLLLATSDVQPFDPANLSNADAATVAAFTKTELPAAAPAKFSDGVQTALAALPKSRTPTSPPRSPPRRRPRWILTARLNPSTKLRTSSTRRWRPAIKLFSAVFPPRGCAMPPRVTTPSRA
jgi:hypothetical protein